MDGVFSTSGTSAVTVTCSATFDGFIVTSILRSVAMITSTFSAVTVAKPASSALSVYFPTGSDANRKLPSISVTVLRLNPVFGLTMVIVTPGSGAVPSVNVPVSDPVDACPRTIAGTSRHAAARPIRTGLRRSLNLIEPTSLSPQSEVARILASELGEFQPRALLASFRHDRFLVSGVRSSRRASSRRAACRCPSYSLSPTVRARKSLYPAIAPVRSPDSSLAMARFKRASCRAGARARARSKYWSAAAEWPRCTSSVPMPLSGSGYVGASATARRYAGSASSGRLRSRKTFPRLLRARASWGSSSTARESSLRACSRSPRSARAIPRAL